MIGHWYYLYKTIKKFTFYKKRNKFDINIDDLKLTNTYDPSETKLIKFEWIYHLFYILVDQHNLVTQNPPYEIRLQNSKGRKILL